MAGKRTTERNMLPIMEEYAVFLFYQQLIGVEGIGALEIIQSMGYPKGTDLEFFKRWKISKNTLNNWRKPTSKFWDIYQQTDLTKWKVKRPLAMLNLLKNDPRGFLRMTWGDEARQAFTQRTELDDKRDKKPAEMTDADIDARLKELEDLRACGGKKA
jgi:hypothetical protein